MGKKLMEKLPRFNFSYGTHEYQKETLDNLMQNTQIQCAVMLDTKRKATEKVSKPAKKGKAGKDFFCCEEGGGLQVPFSSLWRSLESNSWRKTPTISKSLLKGKWQLMRLLHQEDFISLGSGQNLRVSMILGRVPSILDGKEPVCKGPTSKNQIVTG